jgi:hypothetical protein
MAYSIFRTGLSNVTDATPSVIVMPRYEEQTQPGNFKVIKGYDTID